MDAAVGGDGMSSSVDRNETLLWYWVNGDTPTSEVPASVLEVLDVRWVRQDMLDPNRDPRIRLPLWEIASSAGPGASLSDHLESIFRTLRPHREEFTALGRRYETFFVCGMHLGGGGPQGPALALSREQMRQIAELNAGVDFDLYGLDDSWPGGQTWSEVLMPDGWSETRATCTITGNGPSSEAPENVRRLAELHWVDPSDSAASGAAVRLPRWQIRSTAPPAADPDDHVANLLDILRPYWEEFVEVGRRYNASIGCAIKFAGGQGPGLWVGPPQVREIVDLGAGLALDVYGLVAHVDPDAWVQFEVGPPQDT
jgi:hypothetical protein